MKHARTQAFKTALRPTPAQARCMAQHIGYQRWSFNNHLAALQTALGSLSEGEKWPTVASLSKQLRRERPAWALALSQNPFDNGRRNLEDALNRYFKGRRGEGPSVGFPSFHKRGANEAYEASEGHPERIRMDGRKIRLPKVGWVIMAESLPDHDGCRPLQVHVRRDAGRWFVSIVCAFDTPHPVPSGQGPMVGVDTGIQTLAFTSDGRRFANPRALQQSERKLRRCDKAIARSRNTHGPNQHSHRRQDLYDERARLHRRIRWQRETARRMAASAIAKSAGTVVVESLHVRGLVRNQRLAKALSDAGMGSFLTELAWQCTKRGVRLVEADRWFPSTQICACCGCRPDAKVDLSVRVYRCARCGWECDRDANAALNLAAWGAAHAAGEAVNGHGDGVSRPGARPGATVGEVPSDGTPVDVRRSTRIVPHRR